MKENITAVSMVALLLLFAANNGIGIMNGYRQMSGQATVHVKDAKLAQSIPFIEFLGECSDHTLLYGVGIYTAPVLGEGVSGRFYSDPVMIVLTKFDLNTIAHESSHATDLIVQRKGIQDGETRAYIQGAITACVQNLVEMDEERLKRMCRDSDGWESILVHDTI